MKSINQCKTVDLCRACSSTFFSENLDLGLTPIANELYPDFATSISAEKFPLVLRMCSNCRHVQLNHTIAAERLFSSYVYSSSTSASFRAHFLDLAKKVESFCKKDSKIIEVGSNDGFLIQQLDHFGFTTLGIEPSEELVNKSQALGLNVLHAYLDKETVKKVISSFGEADIVIGNNVFAHIDEISGAMSNVNSLLKPNGVFILEVAYLLDLFEKNLFDSIYHEHISYHSLFSLKLLLKSVGFQIIKVERIATHGGSVRVWARKFFQDTDKEVSKNEELESLIVEEVKLGLTNPELFLEMRGRIDKLKSEIEEFVNKNEENSFNFGYTAPAKLVTFLSQMDLRRLNLRFIVDDNLSKQMKFIAGYGLEIVSSQEMANRFETYSRLSGGQFPPICLVFAWNISDEIIEKIRSLFKSDLKIITFAGGVKEKSWK
jgi:SAM-dependent methyltransferase